MSVNPYESPQMASPLGAQPQRLELPLTIEYELALDGHVEFNLCYQRQHSSLWILRLLLPAILMLAVASILLFSVLHLFSNPQGPQDEDIGHVISSVAMFVVAIPFAIWLAFVKPRRFLMVPLIRYLVLRRPGHAVWPARADARGGRAHRNRTQVRASLRLVSRAEGGCVSGPPLCVSLHAPRHHYPSPCAVGTASRRIAGRAGGAFGPCEGDSGVAVIRDLTVTPTTCRPAGPLWRDTGIWEFLAGLRK